MRAGDPNEIATLRRGRLEDVPFAELLHAFWRRRRTLCFELRRQQIRKTIVLEDGSVIGGYMDPEQLSMRLAPMKANR